MLEVLEFNRERNGLSYDEELEIRLFTEEAREFFEAKTTAERIDAFTDMEYVRLGTVLKLSYNNLSQDELPYDVTVVDIAINILKKELGSDFGNVLAFAERIVCEINATKGTELKNGKVTKALNIRNATEEIAQYLEDLRKLDEQE
jgi:hypothetical protein